MTPVFAANSDAHAEKIAAMKAFLEAKQEGILKSVAKAKLELKTEETGVLAGPVERQR